MTHSFGFFSFFFFLNTMIRIIHSNEYHVMTIVSLTSAVKL